MSTSAEIYVGRRVFSMSHDGHPEEVVPYLLEIVEEVQEFHAKDGEEFLSEVTRRLEKDANDEDVLLSHGYGQTPMYTYRVLPDGGVVVWIGAPHNDPYG